MTECVKETLRDLLPELVHGQLSAAEASAVRAHVTECAACLADLALLETARLVLRANAPKVDVAAIARAVGSTRPALRVERGGSPASHRRAPVSRSPVWRSRQLLAAAASLLIVASLSIPFLGRNGEKGGLSGDSTLVASNDSQAGPVARPGLAVSEGLSDLSADDLSLLLDEIDGVEANIAAEPSAVRQPTVDAPEIK